ncbi:hypothetical protein J6590_009487 [Homalodisca vitripennis]|nr:hypothetical protein J6590_009487 [Homalodisca vitripennis]
MITTSQEKGTLDDLYMSNNTIIICSIDRPWHGRVHCLATKNLAGQVSLLVRDSRLPTYSTSFALDLARAPLSLSTYSLSTD